MKKKSFKERLTEAFYYVLLTVILFIPSIIYYYLDKNFEIEKLLMTFNIIVTILIPIIYLYSYIIEKIKLKKIEKKQITKKTDINYYRDIINNYSPAMLSIIYDGNLEYKKDLITNILYLENKGYIKIKNDKIYTTNKDYSKLSIDLKMIIENADLLYSYDLKQSDRIKLPNFRTNWYKAIDYELKKQELCKERDYNFSIISIILVILLGLSMMFSYENNIGLFLYSFILCILIIFIRIETQAKTSYYRTQKGYEIYVKLVGLKKFINDFSNLDESKLEEIKLLEDYSIYTMILNRKNDLIKQNKELYKKLFNKKAHKS